MISINEWHVLLPLATTHFIALMSPGPDVALMIHNTTRYGRTTGLFIALGLSCGILVHSLLSLTGISFIVHQHPKLFIILQLIGGSYLFHLGIKALKMTFLSPPLTSPEQVASIKTDSAVLTDPSPINGASKCRAFSLGVMTNLLNPKALVFFASLMSSLIPSDFSLSAKLLALAILWGLALFWFGNLALLLSTQGIKNKLPTMNRYIDGLCAIIFILIGGFILFQVLSQALSTFNMSL